MSKHNFSETEFIKTILPRALNNVSDFNSSFAPSVIRPDTLLREDLNLDSCDTMQLLLALETKYDISMKKANTNAMVCVNDIYKPFKAGISRKQRIEKLHNKTRTHSTRICKMAPTQITK